MMDFVLKTSAQSGVEVLSELSRATTVYHEAGPDGLEEARQNYLEALRKFNQVADPPGGLLNR